MTVAELLRLYWNHLEARVKMEDYSRGALVRAEPVFADFTLEYGDLAVADLKQHHLTSWLYSRLERWKSPSTRRDRVYAIITAFRWAEDEGLIDKCPVKKVRGLRYVVKPRQAMTRGEIAALMLACMPCHLDRPFRTDLPAWRRIPRRGNRELRRLVFFLRRTGARPGEARALTWADVDWDRGVIRLVEHKTARHTGKERWIGLEPAVLRFLRNLRRRSTRPYVFCDQRGQQWKKEPLVRCFKRWATKAGLGPHCVAYSIRHAFAVGAIENGVGERQLADQMGHTTTRMVSWYAAGSRTKADHLRNVAAAAVRGQSVQTSAPDPVAQAIAYEKPKPPPAPGWKRREPVPGGGA